MSVVVGWCLELVWSCGTCCLITATVAQETCTLEICLPAIIPESELHSVSLPPSRWLGLSKKTKKTKKNSNLVEDCPFALLCRPLWRDDGCVGEWCLHCQAHVDNNLAPKLCVGSQPDPRVVSSLKKQVLQDQKKGAFTKFNIDLARAGAFPSTCKKTKNTILRENLPQNRGSPVFPGFPRFSPVSPVFPGFLWQVATTFRLFLAGLSWLRPFVGFHAAQCCRACVCHTLWSWLLVVRLLALKAMLWWEGGAKVKSLWHLLHVFSLPFQSPDDVPLRLVAHWA